MIMFICNLLEYSDNYSITSESLGNYYTHETNDNANETAANYSINHNKNTTSKLLE